MKEVKLRFNAKEVTPPRIAAVYDGDSRLGVVFWDAQRDICFEAESSRQGFSAGPMRDERKLIFTTTTLKGIARILDKLSETDPSVLDKLIGNPNRNDLAQYIDSILG